MEMRKKKTESLRTIVGFHVNVERYVGYKSLNEANT